MKLSFPSLIPATLKAKSDDQVLWYPSTEEKFKHSTQVTLGVFLQNSSTLGLVSRGHIHNSFIPVLYKQRESVT